MFQKKCSYIINGEEKKCSFRKFRKYIRFDEKFDIPKEIELLQMNGIDLSQLDQIIINNPDTWLILNQCTFSGKIEGGNVSFYPKRDKKEKGVSFIDNQEVEIRFDSQEAILRPFYIFTDVSKVLVSGNANGCIFSNSYSAKENFSHFSFENVIGGNVIFASSPNCISVINSSLDYLVYYKSFNSLFIKDSTIHFLSDPFFSHHTYFENARFDTPNGELEFLKEDLNCSGNLVLARAQYTTMMSQLKKILDERKNEKEKQIVETLNEKHADYINYLNEKIEVRRRILEKTEQHLKRVKKDMNESVLQSMEDYKKQSIGRILKKDE